jgi:hypothetical protein
MIFLMGAVSVSDEKKLVERNLNLMKTLDDAWNAGPKSPLWETFRKRHAVNVAVYWPGGVLHQQRDGITTI